PVAGFRRRSRLLLPEPVRLVPHYACRDGGCGGRMVQDIPKRARYSFLLLAVEKCPKRIAVTDVIFMSLECGRNLGRQRRCLTYGGIRLIKALEILGSVPPTQGIGSDHCRVAAVLDDRVTSALYQRPKIQVVVLAKP